jgi:hypothetical protein
VAVREPGPRPDQARGRFGAGHSSGKPALFNPFAYRQTRPQLANGSRFLTSTNPDGNVVWARNVFNGDLVREDATVGAILLWLLGIPIPIIILLLLLWH